MNILITGSNGFIGNNLLKLIKGHVLFEGNRDVIDLSNKKLVQKFIKDNKIRLVIHCAFEGTKRNEDVSSVYNNLLIFENLCSMVPHIKLINIGSGAELDISKNVSFATPEKVLRLIPTDYYGFSKNLIAKKIILSNNPNLINIRLFGCFYYNEWDKRFIKQSITNIQNKLSIQINKNKYMDFIYMKDLVKLIEFIINNNVKITDINAVYKKKISHVDIANIILKHAHCKVDIKILSGDMSNSYTGMPMPNEIGESMSFMGIENGIKETYNLLCTQ